MRSPMYSLLRGFKPRHSGDWKWSSLLPSLFLKFEWWCECIIRFECSKDSVSIFRFSRSGVMGRFDLKPRPKAADLCSSTARTQNSWYPRRPSWFRSRALKISDACFYVILTLSWSDAFMKSSSEIVCSSLFSKWFGCWGSGNVPYYAKYM